MGGGRDTLSDHLIHRSRVVLPRVLSDIKNADLQGALSEGDLDYVVLLYVIGCLRRSAVHGNVLIVAGIVRNGAPFDHTGYFQKFIKSHGLSLSALLVKSIKPCAKRIPLLSGHILK